MQPDQPTASNRPGRRAKRITTRDVAARAGVSIGTVSNVLHKLWHVAEDTTRRVNEAIAELGWTRHQGAQQLRGVRSTAIGAVVVELSPHTVGLLDTAEHHLGASGFSLQISTSAGRANQELQRVRLFESQRVRGILLSPIENYRTHLASLRQLSMPVVVLGRDPQRGLCSVTTDDQAGAALAINHLQDLGHRRIDILGGTSARHQVSRRRSGAATAAHRTSRLTEISTDTYDIPAGIDAATRLLDLPASQRPTAVFAINDRIAVGLMYGLISAGLTIPDDLSIIGYDNTAIATTAPVPLTTIHNPYAEIGATASRLLLDEITDYEAGKQHRHHRITLQPSLKNRRSTAPPRAGT